MDQDDTLKSLASSLRQAWLKQGKDLPLSPSEVAAFDAQQSATPSVPVPSEPSLAFSWEKKSGDEPAKILPFATPSADDVLSMAARAREREISAESRTKLAELIRQMKVPPPK